MTNTNRTRCMWKSINRTKSTEAHTRPRLQLAPDPVIDAYKKDVDMSLIRRNLKLTVEERLDQLAKLQQFAEDLREAGRKAKS